MFCKDLSSCAAVGQVLVSRTGLDRFGFGFVENACFARNEPLGETNQHIKRIEKETKCWEYNMCGHARTCVERYLTLTKLPETSLSKVSIPCIDGHQLSDSDFETRSS